MSLIGSLGQKIRRFHRTFSEDLPYSILLEGMDPQPEQGDTSVSNNPLVNRWAFMGFDMRQRVSLRGNQLTLNQNEPIEITSPSMLFETLRNIHTTCLHFKTKSPLPFQGGLMGYMGYEFSQWCDPALSHDLKPTETKEIRTQPDLLLIECAHWGVVDYQQGESHFFGDDPTFVETLNKAWANFNDTPPPPSNSLASKGIPTVQPQYMESYDASLTPQAFEQGVETIKDAIVAGELYQANLTLRLTKTLKIDPFEVYEALSHYNPSPFSGLFQWPGGKLLSNSPERLVNIYPNIYPSTTKEEQNVSVRPIAGTRGRGKTPADDEALGIQLLENEKERAEHLMLVDLGRNDLGRISTPGSVVVDEQLILERYSHVTHLVSNITGTLATPHDMWDVIQSVFPGGTITGCPKIRCIQKLSQLEPVPRGFYTGGLGYFDVSQGQMDMNILIRSLFLEETETPLVYNGSIHVGAGIVADSVGPYEYQECLRKAAAILGVLQRHEQHKHECIL